MADETKKYLINIESNLKKYAEEAAEAKKRVDELKASNELLKQSGTATDAEIEANNAALRNAQKEYNQAKKMVDLSTAANNSNTNSRKQLGEILQIEMQALGKLGNGMVKNKDGVLVLNKAYSDQVQKIANTKKAILDYDKALNDGRSNIGRYGEAIEGAFKDAGNKILSMVGPMALVTAAIAVGKKLFEGMKEAIMSTTFAIDLMNKATAISKQLFYDLAVNQKINLESLVNASKIQGELNVLRIKDAYELLEISKINREEQEIREVSIDRTKTHAERLEALNKVKELESKKTVIQVGNLTDEMNAKEKLLKQQPANEKLMLNIIALRAKINDTYAAEDQAMRRIESQRTGFIQEQADNRKKMTEAWYKEIEDNNKKAEENWIALAAKSKSHEIQFQKELADSIKKRRNEREKDGVDEMKRLAKEYQDKLDLEKQYQEQLKSDQSDTFETRRIKAGEDVEILQTILDDEYAILIKSEEYLKASNARKILLDAQYYQAREELQDLAIATKQKELNIYSGLAGAMSNILGEQTAAGKGFAIAQAIIDTYSAALGAMAETKGGTIARFAALAAVILTGFANIKKIAEVDTSGKNTSTSAPTSITSSVSANTATATPVGSTILTQNQLSQAQLNQMPNQNLLTAEDIANALSKLPPSKVYVEDIERVTKAKNKIEVRANI
jgi:hypothetical protein